MAGWVYLMWELGMGTVEPAFTCILFLKLTDNAARLTSRSGKFDSITPVLVKLHWLPIPEQITYKILTTTYKALNG